MSTSPISRLAAVLIVLVGIFTLVFVNTIAGILIAVLGIFLYKFLRRFQVKLGAG
jgi:biopolymer transport protein ExbB/TolQ